MSNPVKGLRVGNYRITPLGLAVLGVIVVLIVTGCVLALRNPAKDQPVQKVTAATQEPMELTTIEPEVTATPIVTPTPSPTPEPPRRSATIRSLGEIAIQQNLLVSAADGTDFVFDDMFSLISDVMGDADYTVADVEGTLGDTADYSGGAALITPSSLIRTLKDCGVDMLMLANDHALDGGFAEQQATVQNCIVNDMTYVGAATSIEEKSVPVIKDINGIQVGFLAYTESLNGNEKLAGNDATAYGVNLIARSNALQDIGAMREAGANVIVCYVSWGEMFKRSATDNQKIIAKALVNAGVDVIIGYNPHVVQPAAWLSTTDKEGNVHRTLCLAATGNFLSDVRQQYADSGLIFEFTIQETEYNQFAITAPRYIPTYVWRYEGEGGKYQYRTLAVGQWRDTEPEGMAYADATRMRQVWAEQQTIMGNEVAEIVSDYPE